MASVTQTFTVQLASGESVTVEGGTPESIAPNLIEWVRFGLEVYQFFKGDKSDGDGDGQGSGSGSGVEGGGGIRTCHNVWFKDGTFSQVCTGPG
jgi:hypothetical protein